MNDNALQPYTVEVSPAARLEGHLTWAIRRGGKLLERSDRSYPTEAKALERALQAIEQDMKPAVQRGRR